AVAVTAAAIDEGLPPQAILDAMTRAMEVVGGKFSRNELYVPEMLISARAMKESTALLEPLLVKAGIKPLHTAVIGTVKGDLHDIGKNLVGMMWKGANIAVVDLGSNVSAEQFVAAAKEHEADLIGVSALLTTTMVGMKAVESGQSLIKYFMDESSDWRIIFSTTDNLQGLNFPAKNKSNSCV
ncbi:MAG: cobalamin-dependent protein, partial [Bacteroidia bacterium]|nr:cobalamin-dependent protein [Bacteroidia bacterium]